MFWKKKKKNAPKTEAQTYTDALEAAFRVPKATPVAMPKAPKRPRPALPKWLRPAILGVLALCLVCGVLFWYFGLRPTRQTEHYLCLTVTDTAATYFYGVDAQDVFWRIDPSRAELSPDDVKAGDVVWVFYNGDGEDISEFRDGSLYTRSVDARGAVLCDIPQAPEKYAQFGVILYDTLRFDIDDDGIAETCRLFNGPTSGMTTYTLVAFSPLGLAERQVIFYAPGSEKCPVFYEKDGTLQILYADMRYSQLGIGAVAVGAWDVRFEDGDIALYAGAKMLDRIIDGNYVPGTEPATIPKFSAISFGLYPTEGQDAVTSALQEISFDEANDLLQKLRELYWRTNKTYECAGEFTLYVGGSAFVYQFTPTGSLVCEDGYAQCPKEVWDDLMQIFAENTPNQTTQNINFLDLKANSYSIAVVESSHTVTCNGGISAFGRCIRLGDLLILTFADSTDMVTLRMEADYAVFLQACSSARFRLSDGVRLPLINHDSPPVVDEQGVLQFALDDPLLYMSPVDSIKPQPAESELLTLSVQETARLDSLLNNLKWYSQGLSSQGFTPVGVLRWTCGGTTWEISFEADGTLLWEGNYTHLLPEDWKYLWGLLQGMGKDMPETAFCADALILRFYEGGIATMEWDGLGGSAAYLRCKDLVLVRDSESWLLLRLKGEDRLALSGIGSTPAGRFSGVLDEIVPTMQLWLPGMDEELMPTETVLSDEQEMELQGFLSNTFEYSLPVPETVQKTGGKAILRGYGYTYALYFDNDRTLTWAVGNECVTEQLTYAKWQQFLQFLFPASEQQGGRYRTLTDQGFLYISLVSGGTAEIYDGGRSLMGRWLQKGGILYVTVKEMIAPGDTAVALPQTFVFRSTGYGGYRYAAELSDQATWQLSNEQPFEQIYIYG